MAHDEAVATQKIAKASSPSKDQPALCPYPDWSAMQAYYGPGVLPPTYFAPAMASGHHAATPYMWGPQPLMPPPYGTPYAAVYPHGGAYPHPLVPMMANPLSAEPAKSANSKEKSSSKKLKETDGTAVSTGSGYSKRTTSSSGDYSGEGSSDVNDLKVSKTPRKRSLDGGHEPTTTAKMEDALTPNHLLGNPAILPSHCFPAAVIKPTATNAANSRALGTPVSASPGLIVPSLAGVSSELSSKDEREIKREKRKQSNRESARRSRLRKQAETEELATQVELLLAENKSLTSEISRLTESSEKLRSENSSLMVKLKDSAAPNSTEIPLDKAAAASSSPRVAENFLLMIDNTNKSGVNSKHTEHSEPMLRQLLGSSPATDVVAAI